MVKTASSIADVFSVVSATGAAADADSLPTGTLYVDGVANAASVTVTNIAGTGLYSWSVTMPALTAGQTAAVVIALTVGGVASHGVVYRAQADTNWQSETHTRIGAAGAGLSGVPWNAAWDAEVQSEVADALAATDAITAATLSAAAIAKIADAVLRRTAANIEASANGDTLAVESLYGLIMASFEAALSGTTLAIRKSDGSTLGTKTVTVDDTADPITGIT